jgi:hypothetical protein
MTLPQQDVSPPASTRRKRSSFLAPDSILDTATLYEYLAQCEPPMAEKLIDIALKSFHAPHQLRSEFAQEIRLAWVTRKPDVAYKPAQIAAYAYRIAYHTVLKSWRELGSAVRLPGSAFRKRQDGSTYVTPGVLAAPLDWNEMDEWYRTDDLADYGQSTGMAEALAAGVHPAALPDGSLPQGAHPTTDDLNDPATYRLEVLDGHRGRLQDLEYAALRLLVLGNTCEAIQETLKLKRGQLQRLLEEAATKLPEAF